MAKASYHDGSSWGGVIVLVAHNHATATCKVWSPRKVLLLEGRATGTPTSLLSTSAPTPTTVTTTLGHNATTAPTASPNPPNPSTTSTNPLPCDEAQQAVRETSASSPNYRPSSLPIAVVERHDTSVVFSVSQVWKSLTISWAAVEYDDATGKRQCLKSSTVAPGVFTTLTAQCNAQG